MIFSLSLIVHLVGSAVGLPCLGQWIENWDIYMNQVPLEGGGLPVNVRSPFLPN